MIQNNFFLRERETDKLNIVAMLELEASLNFRWLKKFHLLLLVMVTTIQFIITKKIEKFLSYYHFYYERLTTQQVSMTQ